MKAITLVKSNGYWVASYYCDDDRLRYSTGVKVISDVDSDQLRLERIDEEVYKYITNYRNILEKPIYKKELSDYLDKKFKPDLKPQKQETFLEDYEEMMKLMLSGKLLKKNKDRYSENSVKFAYTPVLKTLKEYEKEQKVRIKYDLTIEECEDLLHWLIEKDFSKNYIANVVKCLKSFFNLQYNKKHKNRVFKEGDFIYTFEKSDTIALTLEQIEKIYKLKLSGAEERARDVFVFGCFVALRISDLLRINKYHLRGNVFEVFAKKGNDKVIIPVHWIARKIYEKYDGELPTFTRQGFTEHLPEICKKAELMETRLTVITRGGRKVEEFYKIWELVSPHTMRRSYCTFMYKLGPRMGFTVSAIMKVSGHKTENSFFNYIKIDKEESAEEIASNPFFQGTLSFLDLFSGSLSPSQPQKE